MLPSEIYIELLRKQLESQKSTYDYLQLILPIVSGFLLALLGWIFATIQNKKNIMFQLKKDQYYHSRESMTRIVTLISEYLSYLYDFIKEIKNLFNSEKLIDEEKLDDFITINQAKYSFIHQLIRIEFPGSNTGANEIQVEVSKIEQMFHDLCNIQNRLLKKPSKIELDKIENEIKTVYRYTQEAVNNITDITSKVEIDIIRSLQHEAVNLKIATKQNSKEIDMKNLK